jgi:hypothetical protein
MLKIIETEKTKSFFWKPANEVFYITKQCGLTVKLFGLVIYRKEYLKEGEYFENGGKLVGFNKIENHE